MTSLNYSPECIEAVKNTLLKCAKTKSIAFVCDILNGAELPYKIIKKSNEYLEKNSKDEITLFSLNRDFPIIPTMFGTYAYPDLITYYGTVICTDIPTWQASIITPSQKKYLYIYDVARLQKIPPELIEKINSSGYNIMSRSPDHLKFLKKLGFNVSDKYVEDIDIKYFMEL